MVKWVAPKHASKVFSNPSLDIQFIFYDLVPSWPYMSNQVVSIDRMTQITIIWGCIQTMQIMIFHIPWYYKIFMIGWYDKWLNSKITSGLLRRVRMNLYQVRALKPTLDCILLSLGQLLDSIVPRDLVDTHWWPVILTVLVWGLWETIRMVILWLRW